MHRQTQPYGGYNAQSYDPPSGAPGHYAPPNYVHSAPPTANPAPPQSHLTSNGSRHVRPPPPHASQSLLPQALTAGHCTGWTATSPNHPVASPPPAYEQLYGASLGPPGMNPPSQPIPQTLSPGYGQSMPIAHSPVPSPAPMHSLPDMQRLRLADATGPPPPRRTRHHAQCDGCGAFPIRGIRWHCLKCPDEDLCSGCKEAGKKRSHPFAPLAPGVEMHAGVFCDGCGRSPIYGTRSICQQHRDEDWCGDCRRSGKACMGPFKELHQSPLGVQIEQYASVPIPREWLPQRGQLPPAVATYRILDGNETSWLEPPDSLCWMPMPGRARTESATKVKPAFTAEITKKGGNFRDRTYKWTFRRGGGDGKKLWRYSLESDRRTGTAILSEHFGACSPCSDAPLARFEFAHGPKCDSLVFAAPGGTQYRWLTSKPVSTLRGDRWDAQRYILLQLGPGGGEQVVADYVWWDGHPDAPEDCMAIRSTALDHSLALATLTALLDRQWKCLAAEKEVDPKAFEEAVQQARLTPLGKQMYWMAGDVQTAGSGAGGHGKLNAHTIEAVGSLIDATATLVDASGGDGGGGGGGDGGGGGGGAAC